MFLDHFDALISKIILKNKKKYYFNTFLSEKHFKKQSQPHSPNNDKFIRGILWSTIRTGQIYNVIKPD